MSATGRVRDSRAPVLRLHHDELIVEREGGRFLPGVSYSPATQIQPGQHLSQATEIKRGERRAPATEFKKGQPARNKLQLGSVTERADPNGRIRAWVKIGEPSVWKLRAVVAWESVNGPLPAGMVVHHRDHDSLNDEASNLVALTRAQHIAEHQLELATAAVEAAKARAA